MSSVQDHPDIETLPQEVDGIAVREPIREIFRNPENGTPDHISKAGCLALALKSNEVGGAGKGHVVWNAWRKTFPTRWEMVKKQFERLSYEESEWVNIADFSGVNFTDERGPGAVVLSNFSSFYFENCADFSQSEWGIDIDFSEAIFGENANFQNAHWSLWTSFKKTRWGDKANFSGSTFGVNVRFDQAVFGDLVNFSKTTWKDGNFAETSFGRRANFENSTWNDDVYFAAHAKGKEQGHFYETNFSGAKFHKRVNFSNRKFLGTALFTKTQFAIAPTFHGSELHQDTSFEGTQFPPAKGDEESARAYRTLKLAFSKQQGVREEQRFFRLEMEEETLRETGLKRWLFRAYKTFSDYGFSITRPLKYGGLGVLALTLVYGVLSWAGQCGFGVEKGCTFAPQWIEFSLLQTLPLPGLDKLSDAASKAFWPEGAWWVLALSTLVILHKTISLAALFLIGLALRNLFKLK